LWLVACRVVILFLRSGGWYKTFKLSLRGSTFGFAEFTCFLKHGTLVHCVHRTLVQCVHVYTWFSQVSGYILLWFHLPGPECEVRNMILIF
jgi:hypothetical protein